MQIFTVFKYDMSNCIWVLLSFHHSLYSRDASIRTWPVFTRRVKMSRL